MIPETTQKLLQALAEANNKDLEAIDRHIERLEAEIASLLTARKAISERIHGKPQRKPRGPNKKPKPSPSPKPDEPKDPVDLSPLDFKIRRLILDNEGPMMIDTIARRLGVTAKQVAVSASNSSNLERTPDGKVTIAPNHRTGHQN